MLPIDAALPALCEALRGASNAVLVAAPGAGKTTRAPLALLEEPWAAGAKLILLSPRRITARAAAHQLARNLGEEPGGVVGYRVRLDSRVSARTRLEVVTEGVFTRQLQADPELKGIAGVIFDEFHERHLESDVGFALARDAQLGLRPDLRLLVMSATLDAQRVAQLLGECAVVRCDGRLHPIGFTYLGRGGGLSLEDHVAKSVLQALSEQSGDILVFLPGAGEIERVRLRLEDPCRARNVDLRPLHGALDARTQDAAIAPSPSGRRKVVLSTALAESSLTIEGVRVVVDCGLARRPRFEPAIGLTRLETVRASQAAVAQRAGRAGRTQPGACYRLWDEAETRAFPAYDTPEILQADLSGLVLDLASWGASPDSLSWLDPPPLATLRAAHAGLTAFGALDGDGRLTAHGRAIAELPLQAPLAHMLLEAAKSGAGATAAATAVLLTEQGLGGRSVDLAERLERWRRDDSPRARAARRLAQRLAAQVCDPDGEPEDDALGAVLVMAFPDRIAKSRGAGEAIMANGRGVAIDAMEPIAKAAWTVIADVSGTAARARVLAAAVLNDIDVEAIVKARGVSSIAVRFENGAMRARRIVMLGAITVSDVPEPAAPGAPLLAAWAKVIAAQGLEMIPAGKAVRAVLDRIGFLRTLEPDLWPEWTMESLARSIVDWSQDAFASAIRAEDVSADGLLRQLRARMDFGLNRRLDELAPETFVTPLGTRVPIDYACEGAPAIDVRLQELFGVDRHPTVAAGRVRLLLRLLSPAHRPVQVTRDLPSFWTGSYQAVRAEMKGRYPKHPWPDDPIAATPTRRTKPKAAP